MSIIECETVKAMVPAPSKQESQARKRKRATSPPISNSSAVMDPVKLLDEFKAASGSADTFTTPSFSSPTEEMIASYTMDVMTAARTGELESLQALANDDHNLNCCNRFGESLLHFCCRRGYTDMVMYLIQEQNSTLDIVDDSNRSILHFACWSAEPNTELVAYLLKTLPISYVFAEDIRGHTPFAYVRQENWSVWCDLLREHQHLFEEQKACGNKQPRLSP